MRSKRYLLQEDRLRSGLVQTIANDFSLRTDMVARAFDNAAGSIQRAFGSKSGTYLRRENGGVVASGVAGVLAVLPGVEIAIRPKFLANDAVEWETDFAVAVSASLSGHLLTQNPIASKYGMRAHFLRLIAAAYLDEFGRNRRRPIRTYSRSTTTGFGIDGELVADRLGDFGDAGFVQRRSTYSRNNHVNHTMKRASEIIANGVSDSGLANALRKAGTSLTAGQRPDGASPPSRRASLTSRQSGWDALYGMSVDIVAGLSPLFTEGTGSAPGYVFRTWPVWQNLCENAMRSSAWVSSGQLRAQLGTRGNEPIFVTPDIALTLKDGTMFLLDAKYKKRDDENKNTIASADLYESLAFLEATSAKGIVLLFPMTERDEYSNRNPGEFFISERITVSGRIVLGAKVSTRGLGATSGLATFNESLSSGIQQLLETEFSAH